MRGAVLTSAKPGVFLAGADINELLAFFEGGHGAVAPANLGREVCDAFRRIETCGKPVVAAINGTALGGAL